MRRALFKLILFSGILVPFAGCDEKETPEEDLVEFTIKSPLDEDLVLQTDLLIIWVESINSESEIQEIKVHLDEVLVATFDSIPFYLEYSASEISLGEHAVKFTAENATGNTFSEEVVINVVLPNSDIRRPVASFSVSSNSVAMGENIQFTDKSTNLPTTWSWDFGDGNISVDQNPTHAYPMEGFFGATLTVTNEFGFDQETKLITVSNTGETFPVADFSATFTDITLGRGVTFKDQSRNGKWGWSWDFGDGTGSSKQNPSHIYRSTGTYTVSLVVNNEFGADTITKSNYIVVSDHIIETGSVEDIDENSYATVVIGEQEWMAENLRTKTFNDGFPIPHIILDEDWKTRNTPGYSWYFQDNAQNSHGLLYNWYTVETGKLCPAGWHVPTSDEWKTLEDYLISHGYNYDGTDTLNKIAKALSDEYLSWPTTDISGAPGNQELMNNLSGFSALPSGMRNLEGSFRYSGEYAIWWSATETMGENGSSDSRAIQWNYSKLGGGFDRKTSGLSVRCVKD